MSFLRHLFMCFLFPFSTTPTWADPIRIAAASSLATGMTELTQTHDVRITFGPSQRLARQVAAGMPVDLIFLADPKWFTVIEESESLVESRVFLSNSLVVVGERTLTEAEKIGLGTPGVPVGDYARTALKNWGLMTLIEHNIIHASSAAALVSNTLAGHLDAAVVYESDAISNPKLSIQMRIPPGTHEPISYTAGLTRQGAQKPEVVQLYEALQSDVMLAAFEQYGFSQPRVHRESTETTPAFTLDTSGVVMRSIWVALSALILAFPPALGLAWLMARRQFTGKSLLNTVCLAPLVLPPVVTGWILLKIAQWANVSVAFTPWAAVIAAAVVGFPLMLILTRGAIESVDVRYEQQAQTLGMSRLEAFRRVTLPMALPGISAGCILALARALGEFGATALFAGDQPEHTRTLALAVYSAAEFPGAEQTAAKLVGISIVITLIALLAYERLVWAQRRFREDWK
jgi:molybdate transport system permease protein